MTAHNTIYDIAIVGSGPAGMAAAAEFAQADVSVVLLDAYPQLGGHYYRQPPETFGQHPITSGQRQDDFEALRDRAAGSQIRRLAETSIWNIAKTDQGFLLQFTGPQKVRSVAAKVLLLAAGAYDRPFPFPGWHLPGVITLGGAQMLLKGHGIVPGKRILVGGSGPLLLAAAAGLVKAGAEVVAVLDMARLFEGMLRSPQTYWGQWGRLKEAWDYGRTLQKAGVPIKFGQTIFRADGAAEVESATYGSIDAMGRPQEGTATKVDVDTVCAALGFLPNIALSRLLKCEHHYDARLDAFYPIHNQAMETNVANLFVAGDITGVGGKDLSKMQGRIAAWNMLSRLERLTSVDAKNCVDTLTPAMAKERRFLDVMHERMRIKPGTLDLLQDETIVCRCEMTTAGDVRNAVRQGATDLRGVKLRSRTGMGACQSRYCEQTTAQLIMQETGADRLSVGTTSVRPPIIPVRAADMLEGE